MHIHTYNDPDELSFAVADWMIYQISDALKKNGRFTVALSGGSTPQRLYSILAKESYSQKIDWSKVHIFYGDERVVPFEDKRNNAKMTYDTLLNHVPIPASQIHIMKTDIDPEEAARQYESILHDYFDHTETTFDVTLLGMGDDGHTLSVFPGSELIEDKAGWARAIYVPDQSMYRITLTPALVNKSTAVAFLTTGANKSVTLQQVIKGAFNPQQYPSQLICPPNGELYWFIDKEAAKDIT